MSKWMEIPLVQDAVRMPAVWRLRVLQKLAQWGVREETLLIGLAVLIGLAGGTAAWLFKSWVEWLEKSLFSAPAQGLHATVYVFLLPLFPAVGGLLVSLVRWVFRTGKGPFHGLTGVLLSLIRSGGKLPHKTGLEAFVTSGITIGSGGSAGPEAPIAIIGSSLGSSIGALAGISRRNLPTLVGCGAAAGIGAVFDAPIAGVLFALEVMLRDFSVRTFIPIVVSGVIGTTMFHTLLRATPGHPLHGLFEVPTNGSAFVFTFGEVPSYVLLGIFCGLIAMLFTYAMRGVEKAAERLRRVPRFVKPALGAALSGLCGVLLLQLFQHQPLVQEPFSQEAYVPIFSGGYPTILRMIDPSWYQPAAHAINGQAVALGLEFLVALCVLKIVATAFTLGSGGAGGVFAPSLFVGAAAGGIFGLIVSHFVPQTAPSAFALVGMGAVLAAVIQAPLMAILLLFEITRDYAVMLPIMLTAVIATVMYQLVFGESLYTFPLRKQGIRVGSAAGMSALRRIGLDQVELTPVNTIQAGQPISALLARTQDSPATNYVVVDQRNRYLGLITTADLQQVLLQPELMPLLLAGDICRSEVPPLQITETLETALELFARHEVSALAVVRRRPQEELAGMLTRSEAIKHYHSALG
jgi:CIC family chloride channel protein